MGTTLTGTTPQDTYDSLIKVTDNGPLSGTAKYLSDGLGNDSVLALSTSAVRIGTTSGTSKANILSSTVAQTVLTLEGNYSSSGSVELLEFNRSGGAVSGAIKYQDADTAMAIGTTTSHAFIFNMGDVERMRLTATGAVQIKGSSTTTGYQASIENNDTLLTIYGSIFGGTGKGIAFWPTGAAEGMRITSAGDVAIGSTSTSGYKLFVNGSVYFSGTTNYIDGTTIFRPTGTEVGRFTANGLTFNGDTAAANALDDYEEGTWTPTYQGGITGVTYSNTQGRYTKIGNAVHWRARIQATAGTAAASQVIIGGFPFTSASVPESAGCVGYFTIYTTDVIYMYNETNTTSIAAFYKKDGNALIGTDLTNVLGVIHMSGTYFV